MEMASAHFRLHVYHGRKSEQKDCHEADHIVLPRSAHAQPSADFPRRRRSRYSYLGDARSRRGTTGAPECGGIGGPEPV